MKKINNWDDIPSLDGLQVGWEHKPETCEDKRSAIRIKNEDISKLFSVNEILVKVVTVKQTYTGRLLDISAGGLSLSLPVFLEVTSHVKVGFFLGTVKIISKAEIMHTHKIGEQYIVGIQFFDINKDSATYIKELYASTKIIVKNNVKAKILIIDDDPIISALLVSYSTNLGHTATVSRTIKEAKAILAVERFDLVFLDVINQCINHRTFRCT